MDKFLQTVIDGLGNGSIYAGLSLALVLIHRATQIPNLAQGELAMLSAFFAWELQDRGLPWIVALLGAIAISFVLGFTIERGIIRWVEGTSLLTLLIVTLGVLLIVNNGAGWNWGYVAKAPDTPFPDDPVSVGGAVLGWQVIGAVIVLAMTVVATFVLFKYTKLGLGLRGAAMNPDSARLVGIRVGTMLAIGWGLSCAIGATAGVMAAPRLQLQPNMLATVMIFGFAGAVLGGFNSPPGAVLGAFIVGWIQSFAATYWPSIGNDLSLTVALVVIAVVLLVRPNGLFGKAEVSRV